MNPGIRMIRGMELMSMSRSTEITEIRIIKIIGVRIINTLRNESGIFMDGLLMMLVCKCFDTLSFSEALCICLLRMNVRSVLWLIL